MGFKRAEWHSGLTYRQTCDQCHTILQYTDEKLDFLPWYADGFVYCPVCKKPLRHRETYAIDGTTPAAEAPRPHDATVVEEAPANEQPAQTQTAAEEVAFCRQCGKAFREGDRFCAGCGAKRA